jgi:hypothetical protein
MDETKRLMLQAVGARDWCAVDRLRATMTRDEAEANYREFWARVEASGTPEWAAEILKRGKVRLR